MRQRIRHLFSILMVCAMVLSLLSMSVLAEEIDSSTQTEIIWDSTPTDESKPETKSANIIYVKQPGDDPVLAEEDTTGNGSQTNPYASLAKAVRQAQDGDTIELLSDVTLKELAYISGKSITIDGKGHTVYRAEGFVRAIDEGRGGYHSAMIEVANRSELTLVNITLDDKFLTEGTEFVLAGNSQEHNENKVQDGIIASYGDGNSTIILGSDTTLKNFGGLSAVYITGLNGAGAKLIMNPGSKICDDPSADRKGGYAAIFNHGGTVTMNDNSSIEYIDGRAIYIDNGGVTKVNGEISNITSNKKMVHYNYASNNGFGGIAIYSEAAASTTTLGNTGTIHNIISHSNNPADVAIMLVGSTFETLQGSAIKDIETIGLIDSNGGTMKIGGEVSNCHTRKVFFRMRGDAGTFELGETGIITNSSTTDPGIIYMNGGKPTIIISGEISHIIASEAIFISNNGSRENGVCTVTETGVINDISGTGIMAGDPSNVNIYGTINNCGGYAIQYGTTGTESSYLRINDGSIIENNNNGKAQIQITINYNKQEDHRYTATDSINHVKIAPGTLIGNQSVVTPFGTVTLDKDYDEISLSQSSDEAKEEIEDLVQAVEGQSEWSVTGNTLWFKPSEATLHFTVERPSTVEPGIGLHVGYIPLKDDGTPAEDARLKMVRLINGDTIDVTLTGLTPNTSYALAFVVENKYYITINPADITVYMGGEDGAHNVVTRPDGSITTTSKSLPEPGFTFDLPDAITNLSMVTIQTTDPSDSKSWTIQSYDGENHGVYKIVSGTGQDPVRLQFTDPVTQTIVVSDQFTVGAEVNKTFDMSIYKGTVGAVEAVVDGDTGVTYGVILNTGKLHVRGTTNQVQFADLKKPVETGKPGASAGTGTTFTINDSNISANQDAIALLFDNIIENTSSESNRTQLLQKKANETIGKPVATGMVRNYDLKYLDLVDTSNGNTWVTASDDVTVFWPYPAGTDKNTEFTLLHFEDLHRDMASNEVAGDITNGTVSEVKDIQKTDTHIKFVVGKGGFSPFALVWETPSSSTDPGTGGTVMPSEYTLRYETNGGSKIESETYKDSWTKEYEDLPVPVRDGYVFAGWYRDSNLTMPVTGDVYVNSGVVTLFAKWSGDGLTPDDTGVSRWLNTEDHFAYLQGMPNDLFGPGQNITRAEVAQMFYNLLLKQDVPTTVAFTDVADDAWYADAVNALASMGILNGVGGGKFEPTRNITRAEFTAIAMRFGDLDTTGTNPFSDVSASDWFYEEVVGSVQYGWIKGFTDGTFRPYLTITRAEVTVITNRMLGRSADQSYVDAHSDELRQFTDVGTDNWAYYDIAEATNSHDYVKTVSGETWGK